MAHRLSLSKLTGKQGPPPAVPVMSFRYNPCEEGIEELQPPTELAVLPRNESAPSVVGSIEVDRAGKRAGSRDSSTERGTAKEGKEDAGSNRSLSLADRDPLGVADISDAPVRANLLRRHSLENLATVETDALKVESSPVKESVKEYLSKFGKRSAAATDTTAAGVLLVDPKLVRTTPEPTEKWYSGLRERLAKRLEERRHPSGRSKKEDDTKLAPLVGKEDSDDEASRSETPVEEGQEVAEQTDDVAGTSSDTSGHTHAAGTLGGSSASSSVCSQEKLHGCTTLPSGNREDHLDPDLDTWEFVEQVENPQKSTTLQLGDRPPPTLPPKIPGPNFAAVTQAVLESNGILMSMAVGVSAVVLPLPSFLSGLIVGCVISLFVFSLAWFMYVPTRRRHLFEIPDYRKMAPLRVPHQVGGDTGRNDVTSYEGWMCQLPFEAEYHIETHHMNNTQSVHLVLVGSTLRLRRPKHAMPRRAMWNEKRPEPLFVGQRHFNLAAAKVMLLPEKLSKERLWNRKYPICLLVPSEEHYSQQTRDPWASLPESPSCSPDDDLPREYRDCGTAGRDAAAKDASAKDGGRESGAKDGQSPSDHEVLYLFARTCREKEEWFRRFQQAIRSSNPDARPKRPRSSDDCDDPPLPYDSYMTQLLRKHQEQPGLQHRGSGGRANIASATGGLSSNVATSSLLRTTTAASSSSTQWINVLVGRLFYDVFTCQEWSDVVRQRIQRKLNRIKVPFFMEELTVTEIHLGSQLPYIRRTSEAVVDKQGTFTMNHDGSEEESAMSSEEEDGLERPESSTISKDAPAGTGKKLLDLVDKIAQSKYFQQATENRYIKRKMEEVSNMPLVLTVEVSHLVGTLALNVPPPPTDRIWMELVARPKLGEKEVTFARVTERIEKMLFLEFQRILVMPNMDDFMIPIMHSYLPEC
ncbi:hypothetical protein HPB47_004994 [Ixodes persulcatus]|uniref:Uncharacterized protein n=1 Tax=Ixodes persulcatus TaxID=34615 RepID=A0AC60PE62_IXOPE|nr:hypothetical protein HPB47_004994 [Ixodes persulcatus]